MPTIIKTLYLFTISDYKEYFKYFAATIAVYIPIYLKNNSYTFDLNKIFMFLMVSFILLILVISIRYLTFMLIYYRERNFHDSYTIFRNN